MRISSICEPQSLDDVIFLVLRLAEEEQPRLREVVEELLGPGPHLLGVDPFR